MWTRHISRPTATTRAKTRAKKGKQPQRSRRATILDSDDEESSDGSQRDADLSQDDAGLSQDETQVNPEEHDQHNEHDQAGLASAKRPINTNGPFVLTSESKGAVDRIKMLYNEQLYGEFVTYVTVSKCHLYSSVCEGSARVAVAFKQQLLAKTVTTIADVAADVAVDTGADTTTDTAVQCLQKLDKNALVSLFLEYCSRHKRSLAAVQPGGSAQPFDLTANKERPRKRARAEAGTSLQAS